MKAVIFDVDGTLYDQSKLRLRMLFDMVAASIRRPKNIYEIKIIWDFRKAREHNQLSNSPGIEEKQYAWGAKRSGVSMEQVRQVVNTWMFERPLQYLPVCRFAGVERFFRYLSKNNIKIGIFSDYPATQKIKALGLWADVIVCSLDKDVDRLKPNPKGLNVAADKLDVSVTDCLFIGDRDEKDGECARRAGMPFILLKRNQNFYDSPKRYNEIDAWRNG